MQNSFYQRKIQQLRTTKITIPIKARDSCNMFGITFRKPSRHIPKYLRHVIHEKTSSMSYVCALSTWCTVRHTYYPCVGRFMRNLIRGLFWVLRRVPVCRHGQSTLFPACLVSTGLGSVLRKTSFCICARVVCASSGIFLFYNYFFFSFHLV